MSGTSWVTLATNDSYSLGALVLGHSLRRVGTVHHLTVLITPGVTQPMRDKLSKIFNTVKEVNVLDSKDEANLALLSRPELGITFTKLNCWRLTQFSKGVFLDADTLVLQNCDELFDREELSAAPDAGWPDCFNSGVFVFRPSEATYQALIQFALTNGSFDGGDQGLLNLFFSDWATKDISRHLPFIYNMVSTATYSYLPAFKQFGSNVKIAHFIGAAKPWLQYFDTESQKVTPPPSSTHLQGLLQIWWDIFCSQVHPDLSQDMKHRSPPEARLDTAYTHITNPVPPSDSFNPSEEQGSRDHINDPWESYSESISSVQQSKLTEYSDNLNHNSQITPTQTLEGVVYDSHETNCTQSDNISDTCTECWDRLTGSEQYVANELVENINLGSGIQKSDFLNSDCDNSYNQESCTETESIFTKYYSDTSSLKVPTLHSEEEREIENQQSPILISQFNISCEDKHVENTSVNSEHSRVASDSAYNPTESGSDPKAAETGSTAGLAGALAQLTLGVPRSAEQTALEEHLRRQSWEQGNADYMGRDSFDNIWKKISETLAQVPEPKVEEHKPQDTEAKVAELPQITEVPLSQVTQPEFISELKLQCTESKVESTPTSNIESTSPVTPAPSIDKEPVVSANVIDTAMELQTEQKLSVNDAEKTSESSTNVVTETIPTFISEYPPVDQTTLSDSSAAAVLTESQGIIELLKDTVPANIEEVKESSTLVTETKVSDTSSPIESSQSQDVPTQQVTETKVLDTSTPIESSQSQDVLTQQLKESVILATETKLLDTSVTIGSKTEDIANQHEKGNDEAAKPAVISEIPEPAAVPSLSPESLVKSDQQPPPLEESGNATIVMDKPTVEAAPPIPQVTDTTIPSPILASPPEPSQKLESEVQCDAGPKLDIKEPVTSTEQIILSNTTELPPSATESPLLVNVVTDIKIPSQADSDVKPVEPDSSQTLPTVLPGSESLPTPPAAEVAPTIVESAGIQTPIDQPPFVKLSDITESKQSQTPTDTVVPAEPVIEKQVSSPITTIPIESTGQQGAVGSSSDSTIKSTESAPQTPESPGAKPVSTALVAVPKKRPTKLPEAPKPTIPLPAPDSASTPPISLDSQILTTDVVPAESKPESVPLSPILPSPEAQPTTTPTTEENISTAKEKTEIISEAPKPVQDKQVSKEGESQTPTEATKVILEKQMSKEEKDKSKTDSKEQTKPSKVIKQSSKESESSTKPVVSQPMSSTEAAPVKPKPKGLKGPKGPKSPPKDAPQTPPPTKDAPQTPPPTKDAPQTPPPNKDAPQTPTVTAATPPTSPISTPLMSPTSESLKVDQTQPETPPVTSAAPDVSGSSTQAAVAKDPSEATSPPVPPKRKNAKSTATQPTDGSKAAQPKVSKPVKPKK